MKKMDFLKDYYKRVCAPLIFIGEVNLDEDLKTKVYLYDFSSEEEIKNFKKLFQEYMTYYVKNLDNIYLLDIKEDDEDEVISLKLRKDFKRIYKSKLIPRREARSNGIFGELFNDFYLRNIINKELLVTYINKRGYSDGENKGIDIICCENLEDGFEFYFSESKFVYDLNSAKNSLKKDIEGDTREEGHINENYLNDYLYFILSKQNSNNEAIKEKINNINRLMMIEDKTFIESINQLNYSIKFIYFAIFKKDKNRRLESFISAAKEILGAFNANIYKSKIKNYSMEIVFIPTFNDSMVLKNEMENTNE